MFKKNKSIIISFILCLLILLTAVPAFADAGDGTGSGNGENRDIALTLVSSSIEDGATDVALNETIQLNFNKNICNVTVLSNNKLCFHLTNANGEPVAIRLIFPDNQVQHDHRREVFIQPQENLLPDSTYRVSVDNTLMAKNGTTIDDAHVVTFTTGTELTDTENDVLNALGDYVIVYETQSGENENSIPVNKSGLDDISEDSGSDAGSVARIAAIILIGLIIIFTVIFVSIKRKRK